MDTNINIAKKMITAIIEPIHGFLFSSGSVFAMYVDESDSVGSIKSGVLIGVIVLLGRIDAELGVFVISVTVNVPFNVDCSRWLEKNNFDVIPRSPKGLVFST